MCPFEGYTAEKHLPFNDGANILSEVVDPVNGARFGVVYP
jgi:hypothetical protein